MINKNKIYCNLKKSNELEAERKLQYIKCSDGQKALLNQNIQLLNKAFVAQKLMDKCKTGLFLGIIMIVAFIFFSYRCLLIKENLSNIITVIVSVFIPLYIAYMSHALQMMQEVDNATIYDSNYQENSFKGKENKEYSRK
ncbi:hypothetical protein CIRMBP1197_02294 [Enterococcus cecorum]|nr:hypothetical protein CIRMBP1197_02294 [Enterococcus cecorum]